jgi:hypothetical protein
MKRISGWMCVCGGDYVFFPDSFITYHSSTNISCVIANNNILITLLIKVVC